MLLGDKSAKTDTAWAEKGLLLIQSRQYAQAYLLLSRTVELNPREPSVWFNLGLCLLYGRQGEKAVEALDQGLRALTTSSPMQEPTGDMEALAAIQNREKETQSYRMPMYPFEAELFPKRSRERFLRLIADGCVLTGDRQRIRQIAALLEHKGYRNIVQAIQATKPEEEE